MVDPQNAGRRLSPEVADDANDRRNLPRELLTIVVDDEIGSPERARLRKLFVLLGRRPSQTAALTTLLLEHNDGLTATAPRADSISPKARRQPASTAKYVADVAILGPLAAGGERRFPSARSVAIATIGTGGATLIALGGIAMFAALRSASSASCASQRSPERPSSDADVAAAKAEADLLTSLSWRRWQA